jgi:hypothetical protein
MTFGSFRKELFFGVEEENFWFFYKRKPLPGRGRGRGIFI